MSVWAHDLEESKLERRNDGGIRKSPEHERTGIGTEKRRLHPAVWACGNAGTVHQAGRPGTEVLLQPVSRPVPRSSGFCPSARQALHVTRRPSVVRRRAMEVCARDTIRTIMLHAGSASPADALPAAGTRARRERGPCPAIYDVIPRDRRLPGRPTCSSLPPLSPLSSPSPSSSPSTSSSPSQSSHRRRREQHLDLFTQCQATSLCSTTTRGTTPNLTLHCVHYTRRSGLEMSTCPVSDATDAQGAPTSACPVSADARPPAVAADTDIENAMGNAPGTRPALRRDTLAFAAQVRLNYLRSF